MEDIPAIESVMTSMPLSVELDQPLQVAEDLMIDHEIRHLPVTEGGQLVGVISDRDLAFTSNGGVPAELVRKLHVRDVCALGAYEVDPDTRLDVVVGEMAERRIGSAIVTHGGKVAGVFTATDACRCFAEFLRR